MIINIPLTFCTALLLTLASLICLAERDSPESDKSKDRLILLSMYTEAVLNLVSGKYFWFTCTKICVYMLYGDTDIKSIMYFHSDDFYNLKVFVL